MVIIFLFLCNNQLHVLFSVKTHPHPYANANKACRTEVNANECQKVACSAFAAQANEQVFHWLFISCSNECTMYHHICMRMWTRHAGPRRMPTNAKKLLVQCLPHKQTSKRSTGYSFAARINVLGTSTSVWLWTYFSLKYRLQTDGSRLFAEHTPHKRMLLTYTSTLCVLRAFSHWWC